MSGPIVRKYGFANFEKIFGEKPVPHGKDEAEVGKDAASLPPDLPKDGSSTTRPAPIRPGRWCRARSSARPWIDRRSGREAQDARGVGVHGVEGLLAVHAEEAVGGVLAVVGQDGDGVVLVDLLAEGHDLVGVVLAAFEGGAVEVAGLGDAWGACRSGGRSPRRPGRRGGRSSGTRRRRG